LDEPRFLGARDPLAALVLCGTHRADRPWERITDPRALQDLMEEAGIRDVEIAAESGRQALRSPEDWWTIVLGSGFRWTVEQLGERAAEQVRRANVEGIRRRHIGAVETNAVFATARKPLWLSA
jgi:hypothetical protein